MGEGVDNGINPLAASQRNKTHAGQFGRHDSSAIGSTGNCNDSGRDQLAKIPPISVPQAFEQLP
jgi:hypothetical protein